MREIRQSGSEGGVTQFNASSLPPIFPFPRTTSIDIAGEMIKTAYTP